MSRALAVSRYPDEQRAETTFRARSKLPGSSKRPYENLEERYGRRSTIQPDSGR
jgi:hypothetical protein